MPKKNDTSLNVFLVAVFNDILRIEEQTLTSGRFKQLSIREMHIIEAVCAANREGRSNRTTDIARDQGVTPGTLTVAVNSLVKKGCVERRQDECDKRIIRLFPTDYGCEVNNFHAEFHRDMVLAVTEQLNDQEQAALTHALAAIRNYFDSKK